MRKKIIGFLFLVLLAISVKGQSVMIEAESFTDKGGWLVDPQFVEQMGSPYLLAHGMGTPVEDAQTSIRIKKKGNYHVWVRTKNWAPGNWEAPGRFYVAINGKRLHNSLGVEAGWNWEYAGNIKLSRGDAQLSLHDMTGFEGRCDAIYLTLSDKEQIPNEADALKEWRVQQQAIAAKPDRELRYDLVVVGGGLAGCAASIAAAEQGMKVALVHDRPVLGGNASSEVRVHTLGIYGNFKRILKMIDTEHYPNGSAEALDDEKKRHRNMESYENIDIFFNFRAFHSNTKKQKITSVDARHTSTGEFARFHAPLFVDCTGDGWIGYWAGAEYRYGREAVSEFEEGWNEHGPLWSPEVEDNFVMGSSVLWGSENAGRPVDFPNVPWAMEVAQDHAEANGEWQWEFSRNDLHQIHDAETIRDHMFKAIFGSFYNYKQQYEADSLRLKWVSYLVGKRESRRLMGDYIYTFNDVRERRQFEDAVVIEEREVDVHYQQNLLDPEKPDFLSEAMFYRTEPYYIPYRCFYSRNIENLFMAGRDFSCSHIGLGGPRVMRTTGQMGAAVGIAASICKRYQATPRAVYESHLKEYLDLIESQK